MNTRSIIPLTPSTGSVLNTAQIVGREKLIEDLYKILERQGFVLYAERRFGKSSVLRKMKAVPRSGFLTIYKGVEGATSPAKFVSDLYDHIRQLDILENKFWEKAEKVFDTITSKVPEIGPVKFNNIEKVWQQQLVGLLDQLVKQNPDSYIVIMLDEFTIMLNKLDQAEAVNMIGFLKDLVQHDFFKRLRFVYCGSIGIDLVLDRLKKAGFNIGDPINHMNKQRLHPFSDEEAMYFCNCLCAGCELELTEDLKRYICKTTDNIPYFIDRLFDLIKQEKPISKRTITNAVSHILEDPDNPDNLKHFYDRIDNYYPHKTITNYALNFLSTMNKYAAEEAIENYVAQHEVIDKITFKEEIDRLWRDGYLDRKNIKGKRHYKFRYSIIKKWWLLNKAD